MRLSRFINFSLQTGRGKFMEWSWNPLAQSWWSSIFVCVTHAEWLITELALVPSLPKHEIQCYMKRYLHMFNNFRVFNIRMSKSSVIFHARWKKNSKNFREQKDWKRKMVRSYVVHCCLLYVALVFRFYIFLSSHLLRWSYFIYAFIQTPITCLQTSSVLLYLWD